MSLIYDNLENYENYKKTFHNFKTVEVSKTKHSIKIDFGKRKVFLNKNGEETTNVLGLINRVKKDAKNYVENKKINKVFSNDVLWSYYNYNTNEKNGNNIKISKIDLTAAYWTKAQNIGLLSKETINYFNAINFKNNKDKKEGRLKALGSLATVKLKEQYTYGKKNKEFSHLIKDEVNRSIYIGICNEVANDMQTVLQGVEGIYYYWDCIWVEPTKENEVKELFKAMGYRCTVENHEAYIVNEKYIAYLCCPNKEGKLIRYPIKN